MAIKGAKVLVTGGTGQVGGEVAARLARENDTWAIARFTVPGSRDRVEARGLTTRVCDFTTGDFSGVPEDFDYVVHIAGNLNPATAERGMIDHAEGTALLMGHCRRAKAFLYISTTGVYYDDLDPYHAFHETDRLGGHALYPAPHYGPTKLAAEGVVRGLALLFGLPSIIVRLNGVYGVSGNGGTLGMILEALVNGQPVDIPAGAPRMFCPIHEDDLGEKLLAFLEVATVPATICNLGGDDMLSTEECARYMAGQLGIEPVFRRVDDLVIGFGIDNERRRQLVGACSIGWRDGLRRMIAGRHPEVELKPAGAV